MRAVLLSYLLFFLLTQLPAEGMEYFVSLSGDDGNPGTISRPFQHVHKAVSVLKPGDVCTLREGRYSEEVAIMGLQGSPGSPITFRAFLGETVLFDGTVPLVSKWDKYKDNIYKTTVETDTWQLFVDGTMQVNARWPNAFWNDFSVFDYVYWGFSDMKSTYDHNTGTGVMSDNGTQNLAGSGLNATGAIAILNIGSWSTWAGYVVSHNPGDNFFKYDLSVVPDLVSFKPGRCRYFLEDKLEFLDAPTEWYYDKPSGSLFLWTEAGDAPGNYEIRSKASTYAFTVTNGSSWLVFSNISFFATTVFISGGFNSEEVHNIVLDSLHFSYPSYTRRMLGSLAPPNTTTITNSGDLTESSGNFTIFNCTWEYADGQTMEYRGASGRIENNLWHHNDFTCVGNGFLFESRGIKDYIYRNVIHSNGPSVGFSPGRSYFDKSLGQFTGSLIKLNLFYDLKYLQNDGSFMQVMQNCQENAVLEQNWGYNTLKYGMRFDCGVCNASTWGHNGTMRYNVIWNTGGISAKGNNHSIINNLVFNTTTTYSDVYIEGYPGRGMVGENNDTSMADNILEHGACSEKLDDKCQYPVPGKFVDNMVGNIYQYLRDPANLDFRPKVDSSAIKGLGPYGQESLTHGGTYWIPGRLALQASFPIPPNATTTAKCNADLMWLTGYKAESHDVYFGSNKTSVMAAMGPSSGTHLAQLSIPSNIASPGPLKAGSTYFWRVDAVSGGNVKKGNLWSFQCILDSC